MAYKQHNSPFNIKKPNTTTEDRWWGSLTSVDTPQTTMNDPISKASRVLSGGIKKVGDFVINTLKDPLGIRQMRDDYNSFISERNKSTGPKGPVDTPSSTLPQGKLPAGTTQKMGLMIKKLRKIPVPQSTTPELPKGTEKSTMGLFNPQPPKKSTSELKVLTGTDLSKHKRKIK